ncbi:MAG: neutral/alkaline non-lysosomal ceramidase N-terminal domain-containing protein [Anaerolineae bacterium]
MANKMLVGSGQVDITPPLTIPYLAYHPRQDYFKGVHDPLYAKAIVFDNEEERVGVICADSIGFANHLLGPSRHFTDELRARVKRLCGLEPTGLMLAATHAHSTNETLGITRLLDVPAAAYWLDTLLDQLASAVVMACNDLQSCELKVGRGEVIGVGHNRRPAWSKLPIEGQIAQGRLDPQLQVLVCQNEEKNARQVLINFQTHPVTVQVQPLVSADYPGYATAMVQRNLSGCRACLFMQGAAGNINPLRDDTRDFRDVALYGTMVAGEALKLTGRLLGDDVPPMADHTLKAVYERVTIPPRPLPNREDVEAKLHEARERERQAADADAKWKAGREAQVLSEALDVIERYSRPQEAEVQVLRVGDLAIASTPGEMFTEWGLRIKKESVAPYTFVSELTNGWVGYLLNPGGFAEGGYETSPGTWTQTNEEGAAMLTETALSLIKRLWQ